LLDEQPFHSAHSIAEALRVSHSTILGHLRESLCMKIFYLRWIPEELTTSLRQILIEICPELSPILKDHEKIKLKDLRLGTRVGSLWNFVILRNGAYREMMFLKR
jgi:hypothetical protein